MKCRVCGQLYEEDLRPIDTQVTESQLVLDKIYERFNSTGTCDCPLCKSLNKEK